MEDPTSHFDTVPEELIVRILSFLDLKHMKKIKYANRRFQSICLNNSQYLRKRTVIFSISATKDESGEPLLDIETCDPTEFSLRCSPTQIIPKVPFYLDWGYDKILEQKHYKQRYEKYIGFLESVSNTIGDGRDFNLEPLPVTSLESGFQASLDFLLRRCQPERLEINEDGRKLTAEEMKLILKIIKSNRTVIECISRRTETIDDTYMELINRTRCESISFSGSFEEERIPDESEFSVEKRISKLSCNRLTFYEEDIISVDGVLNLLKEWRDGTRKLRSLSYYNKQVGLDWFPLVKNDFKVISEPEPDMWTMNADVYLHRCAIGRYTDDEVLDLNYFDNSGYMEIKNRAPIVERSSTPVVVSKSPDIFEEEDDDFGFGLFD